MAGLGDLFGAESTASQFLLWGVAYGFASALLGPNMLDIQQAAWRADPSQTLSPADLADLVVKNIMTQDDAADQAQSSGLSTDKFANLVLGTGEPPGLEMVLEMARRQFIAWDYVDPTTPTVEGAVRTSHIYDEWYAAIRQMGDVSQPGGGTPISPSDAVEAALRNQRPLADMETEAGLSGLNPERFGILLDTSGNPPSPGELVEFARRQLIPLEGTGPNALTFQQGIYEGDSKDKWEPLYEKLLDYIPPPRSIATLQSHGVIDAATATALYAQNGLSPELAGIYAASAVATKVAANKAITEGNILKLYYDRLIDGPTATTMLGELGYDGPTSAYLLELQDFSRSAAVFNGAVTLVGRMYTSRKVTRTATIEALQQLDVPAGAITQYMGIWDTEIAANVRGLTEGQITAAFYYGIKDQAWCMAALEAIGYSPHDAWVILSARDHGPLPDEPPDVPGAGLGASTTEGL